MAYKLGLKIPFLNKKNYVVLKCYTDNSAHLDYTPIKIATKDCPIKNTESNKGRRTFRGCYGRVEGLKRSATFEMPCTLKMTGTKEGIVDHTFSDGNTRSIDIVYDHTSDPDYTSIDTTVTKMLTHWQIQETTGAVFILAKHIQNKTMMNIPTGVVSFKHQHSLNIFNQVASFDHSYEVPFKTPVASLYLASDKKLIVECYYDVQKQRELLERSNYNPMFSNTTLKLHKMF